MGMWLYSFCDILNYVFTQIFIIDIQKRMIMQQTLFIVILAVVIVFALAYRWKKKAENKMGNMSLNYKSKQQIFFLTKADIVKMMSMVEIRIPIEYTLIGAFKQETIRRENTIIDLASNPTGVELSTGGIYDNAENVLIAGRVAVFTDSSIEAMQIYKEILRAMNKCFTKKNNIFVSQEVLSLLEDGWRLTCNYNAPCENDFK